MPAPAPFREPFDWVMVIGRVPPRMSTLPAASCTSASTRKLMRSPARTRPTAAGPPRGAHLALRVQLADASLCPASGGAPIGKSGAEQVMVFRVDGSSDSSFLQRRGFRRAGRLRVSDDTLRGGREFNCPASLPLVRSTRGSALSKGNRKGRRPV